MSTPRPSQKNTQNIFQNSEITILGLRYCPFRCHKGCTPSCTTGQREHLKLIQGAPSQASYDSCLRVKKAAPETHLIIIRFCPLSNHNILSLLLKPMNMNFLLASHYRIHIHHISSSRIIFIRHVQIQEAQRIFARVSLSPPLSAEGNVPAPALLLCAITTNPGPYPLLTHRGLVTILLTVTASGIRAIPMKIPWSTTAKT